MFFCIFANVYVFLLVIFIVVFSFSFVRVLSFLDKENGPVYATHLFSTVWTREILSQVQELTVHPPRECLACSDYQPPFVNSPAMDIQIQQTVSKAWVGNVQLG